MDDFLGERVARTLAQTFPEPDANWIERKHLYSDKHTWNDLRKFPVPFKAVIADLHDRWLRHWSNEFGRELLADPELFGGGLHLTTHGGHLGIHADFLDHPSRPWRRALNLLLYLNPDWKPGDGGELELWSRDMKRCEVSIAPIHNRAVLFETSEHSFHGHPEPFRGAQRRSLALYFYVAAPRTGQTTTDYRPRPQDWAKRLRRTVKQWLT